MKNNLNKRKEKRIKLKTIIHNKRGLNNKIKNQ